MVTDNVQSVTKTMLPLTDYNIQEHGFQLIPGLLCRDRCRRLLASIENKREIGIRQVHKKIPDIYDLTRDINIISQVQCILSGEVNTVRVILFDKSAENNWSVSWHQDRTVAVNKKIHQNGWGPWSIKEGIDHVQVPTEILSHMLTLRIHLDDSDQNNGCLKVIPGSHRLGVLHNEEIRKITAAEIPVACEVKAGDALLMRPQLIHSSGKALTPGHRRVVHIEYSDYPLPLGLHWA